jgi:hypothetical protein
LFFYPVTLFFQATQRLKIFLAKALLSAIARLNLLAPTNGHFSNFIYAADHEQELALADPAPVAAELPKDAELLQIRFKSSRCAAFFARAE